MLVSVAREILVELDAGRRERASDLMWLWVLGAYEVLRTMCQAYECFAAEYLQRLSTTKVEFERVRVANTKMERVNYDRRTRSIPICSDREADVWDPDSRDLMLGDPFAPASARALLHAYETTLAALTAADVRCSHEDSFRSAKQPR